MISFTFDDFPVSAVTQGADILSRYSIPATYYACSGLEGLTNLTGELYTSDHLNLLATEGHEIGAHTHTHLDCSDHDIGHVLKDISQNESWLNQRDINAQSFAYPYGETTVNLKSAIKDRFVSSRGILPGINRVGSDLTQLRSMELSPDAWTHNRAIRAIENVARNGGWLILFTHDVRNDPSPYGVQPDILDRLAKQAQDSGAQLVTVFDAAARLARLTI